MKAVSKPQGDAFGIGPFLFDDPREGAEIDRLFEFVRAHGAAAFSRDPHIGGHVTGSAFVLSPCRQNVLLTHHAKLDRWLQLGGHCDGITDVRFVALKEAYEESGLPRIDLLSEAVLDVDIHSIPANRHDPEHLHYDVRFLMQARSVDFKKSHESKALSWVPLAGLVEVTTDASLSRLRDKAAALITSEG